MYPLANVKTLLLDKKCNSRLKGVKIFCIMTHLFLLLNFERILDGMAFYDILAHFRQFLCAVVTLISFSSNLRNFEKNPKIKYKKNLTILKSYFFIPKSPPPKKTKTCNQQIILKNLKYSQKNQKKKT